MSYNWNYVYLGGVPRVKLATGEDIAHLGELNEKFWTVLSCPVKGLQIDEKSLDYIDANKDAQVHVSEVVETAQWLCRVVKDPNVLTKSTDTIALNALNADTEEGQQILQASQQILASLGKSDATSISLADSSSSLAAVMASKLETLKAERAAQAVVAAPFGDKTDAVAEAYAALTPKVKDFFLRTRLAQFASESSSALDVQTAQIEAISSANLTEKAADIASYPLARICATEDTLSLDAAINPAWAAQWETVRPCFSAAITEASWDEVGGRLSAYQDYLKSQEVSEADIVLDDETANVQLVDKFLHLLRDFFTLLNNFVSLSDFYQPAVKAIFQAGTLYIDQRACDLCMRVVDPAAMAAQASQSGLFLVFCHCTSKVKGQEMDIVAAVTVGDVTNITVGKNAIFYDRQGHDWDARVTNVIDNPISIAQAAWSPYKKFAAFAEEKIRSMAKSREDSVIDKASSSINEKADAAAEATAQAPAVSTEDAKAAGKNAASAFDIAKFAGIFAAIGMAIGFIGSAITSIVTGFLKLTWWQMPLSILAIFLLISGPSMLLAWLKLRKRNIAPLLNANGWAVNAGAIISTRFGNALTEMAKFPLSSKLRRQDPYADKETPLWKKYLSSVLVVLAVVAALWFFKVISIPGIESPFNPAA